MACLIENFASFDPFPRKFFIALLRVSTVLQVWTLSFNLWVSGLCQEHSSLQTSLQSKLDFARCSWLLPSRASLDTPWAGCTWNQWRSNGIFVLTILLTLILNRPVSWGKLKNWLILFKSKYKTCMTKCCQKSLRSNQNLQKMNYNFLFISSESKPAYII